MRNINEDTITDAVLNQLGAGTDPRLKEVLSALVRHVHEFVREVELTEAEWEAGIRFLTEAAAITDDKRNEFILLSDVLGVSILVDCLANKKPDGATDSSVLGPFYREDAPKFEGDASIQRGEGGDPVVLTGTVTDEDGQPIAGAVLDIWQTGPNGLYESQDPDQPDMNLRGKVITGADGRYRLNTVMPVSYSIPSDGPVGALLGAVGRHTYRPAHIHFKVSAPGHESVTTMLFAEDDPYLDSDVVYGVKSSLVVAFEPKDKAESADDPTPPFFAGRYDFGLKKAAAESAQAAE